MLNNTTGSGSKLATAWLKMNEGKYSEAYPFLRELVFAPHLAESTRLHVAELLDECIAKGGRPA